MTKPTPADAIGEIRKRNGFALDALAEDYNLADQDRSDLIDWIAQSEGNVATLLQKLSDREAEVGRLKAVMMELLDAMDAEGTATMRFERMAENEGAYDEYELAIAQDAAADAICTVSEAITKARRALTGQSK